ncbi:MAG: pentapeptide repeat-containing protein, partial [Pseudonocardia sp.]
MSLRAEEWERWQAELSPTLKRRFHLLRNLVEDGGPVTVGQVAGEFFPDSNSAASRQRSMHRFVEAVNEAASVAGLEAYVRIDAAKSQGDDRTVAVVRGLPHEPVAHSGLAETEALGEVYERGAARLPVKPRRRLAFVAAAADYADAKALFGPLGTALATSLQYAFEVHFHTSDGDDVGAREAVLSAALADADVWIWCLSNQAVQDATCRHLIDHAGHTCLPIALSEVANCPREVPVVYGAGLAGTKSYQSQATPARKTSWINGLAEQVHARLARTQAGQRAQPHAGPPFSVAQSGTRDVEGLDAYPLRGSRGLRADGDPARADVEDVLAELETWATAGDSRPLAALLGEYGMGKTITSQLLARNLWARATPDAHYFDLRDLPSAGSVEDGATIIDVLAGIVHAGWTSGGRPFASQDKALAHVEKLLERSRKRRTVWILDGLDEILVHLSSRGQVRLLNQMLRLRPRGGDDIVGADNRLMLTCRTHYFPTLQAQLAAFTDQHRSATTDLDYLGLVLLPLTDDQIVSYLDTALRWGPPRVREFLGSVHDLRDLSGRPFLLTQIQRLAPRLEGRALLGVRTTAAGIYVELVADWLARDEGKHEIADEHKVDLMGFLAARLWQTGSRSAEVKQLNRWLFDYLADAGLEAQYRGKQRDALVADLRTATFLVRPDRGDGNAFRFAHTSFQEYFLAHHLLRALEDDQRHAWRLPLPSGESLRFLGQLLQAHPEQARLLATLESWRSPYLPLASEAQLGFGLNAREHGLPAPRLTRMDLRGAQLVGWTFTGTADRPLDLSRCTLAQAVLSRTQMQHVRLDGADLGEADLRHVVWDSVSLQDTELCGSRWDGSLVRGSMETALPPAPGLRVIPGTGTPAGQEGTRLGSPSGHTGGVSAVAYSPDGTRVVSAGDDGTLRCWDAATGDPVGDPWTGHTNWVSAVAYSPDGTRVVSAGDDGTLRCWDAATGDPVGDPWTGHTNWVSAVAYSPDG